MSGLPATLSSFVGRDRELAEITQLLAAARLVTLTGAGGAGKTRLALEAARAHSARFVELAQVTDDALVESALLEALGIAEPALGSPLDAAVTALAAAESLLVLDNCEHVLDGASAVAAALLHGCPQLRVLATSREPLRVPGEALWPVPPLALDGDATALFVERARAANPGFALTPDVAAAVESICTEVDGVPLAIELAAARVRMFSADQVAAGLGDRLRLLTGGPRTALPRQRTLRASIAWSHDLLDASERTVFRRLAVFEGSFDLAAAEAVCAAGDVLETVSALVDKSLLDGRDGRFRMLAVIREFATGELLTAGEADAVADRHLVWFTALAATGERAALSDDAPNLRVALDHATVADPAAAVALAARLGRFWVEQRRYREGLEACERALAAGGEDAPAAIRAEALWSASTLALQRLDLDPALRAAHDALSAAEQSDDPRALGLAHSALGAALNASAPLQGLPHNEQAVVLLRQAGDEAALCDALATLAMGYGHCNQMRRAREAAEECVGLSARLELPRPAAFAEIALAWSAIADARFDIAREHADRALEHEPVSGSVPHAIAVAFRLHALVRGGRADVALREGVPEIDRAMREDAGLGVSSVRHAVALAELALGDLDAAAARAALDADDDVAQLAGDSRYVLAMVALARGDADAARSAVASLRALAAVTGVARHRALAELAAGRAELLAGAPDEARPLLYSALETLTEIGMRHQVVDAVEALAALVAAEDPDIAARLLAAAIAERERTRSARIPPDLAYWDALAQRLRDEAASAWAAGADLPLDDAIAYARRGRGRRSRPASGWDALTPTEAEVAALCASGLTNPQIAERLFMSRATVKRHLARVFEKVGVSGRAQLAAAAARREA